MKTKKEILAWYFKRGELTSDKAAKNDRADFEKHIAIPVFSRTVELHNGKMAEQVEVMPARSKYPLILLFLNGENFRIVGY